MKIFLVFLLIFKFGHPWFLYFFFCFFFLKKKIYYFLLRIFFIVGRKLTIFDNLGDIVQIESLGDIVNWVVIPGSYMNFI
jgi:hypothetical protein